MDRDYIADGERQRECIECGHGRAILAEIGDLIADRRMLDLDESALPVKFAELDHHAVSAAIPEAGYLTLDYRRGAAVGVPESQDRGDVPGIKCHAAIQRQGQVA